MKRNEEDEIQVLGKTSAQHGKNLFPKWDIITSIVIALLLLLCIILLISKNKPVTHMPDNNYPETENLIPDSMMTAKDKIVIIRDSINDVPLTIYSLIDLKAELSIGWPNDTNFYYAAQAADIRKDNQEILGDYVIRGEQIAQGKRKPGYVALIEGNVSLGISSNDEMKDLCIKYEGDFFRQYAFVIDGEIQENKLKGKALRRAIAKQGNELFIIESHLRESIYDFSEAIADLGITNAIYLVGGNSYGAYRDSNNHFHEFGSPENKEHPNTNFIVFRKK